MVDTQTLIQAILISQTALINTLIKKGYFSAKEFEVELKALEEANLKPDVQSEEGPSVQPKHDGDVDG